MGLVPLMWSVWGALVVLMLAVSIYAARLGRNEEAQIFLADSSNHVKAEQDAIAARVNKVEPVKRTVLLLAGAMTAVVAVYYILDMVKQFR